MSHKIIEALTPEHFGRGCEFWNSRCDWFLSRDQIKLHHYTGSLLFMDLTHAMKPGHECEKFVFRWWPDTATAFGISDIFRRHQFDLRAVLEELRRLPWQRRRLYGGGFSETCWQEFRNADLVAVLPDIKQPVDPVHTVELYREAKPSIRVFSPFAKLNPLPAAPAKWTVKHVLRALLNGQFTDLQCNGVYTDDYAFDAACNYRQGPITNALAFARRIMESPSGWWAYAQADRISICCHHFDSNSFRFVLNPPKHETHPDQPTAAALC